MPRRLRASLVALAFVAAACGGTAGPSSTIALEQLASGRAREIADARTTARAFVEAYARSGEDRARSLARLIAGRELTTWARWLVVQNDQFASVRGEATVTSVLVTDVLDRDGVRFASVDVLAEVRLDVAPIDAEPFSLVRSFDGPMTLARDATSGWLVVDATRDGALMSDGIVVIDDAPVRRDPLRVEVAAAFAFAFAPSFQFNLVVSNLGRRTLRLVAASSGVDAAEGLAPGVVTDGILVIAPGRSGEGIVAVPSDVVVGEGELVLVYTDGGRITEVRIDLAGLLGTVAVGDGAPPSPSASV